MWAIPKCPSTGGEGEKMSRECVCVQYDMFFSPTTLTTYVNPEGIKLSEMSQTQKGKHCLISLLCGI